MGLQASIHIKVPISLARRGDLLKEVFNCNGKSWALRHMGKLLSLNIISKTLQADALPATHLV